LRPEGRASAAVAAGQDIDLTLCPVVQTALDLTCDTRAKGMATMRRAAFFVAAVFMLLSGAAYAQDEAYIALTISDPSQVCIYGSRIYSIGAMICIAKDRANLCKEKGQWEIVRPNEAAANTRLEVGQCAGVALRP
jgi:hypothetical protein